MTADLLQLAVDLAFVGALTWAGCFAVLGREVTND
jgi:hypothetical protein